MNHNDQRNAARALALKNGTGHGYDRKDPEIANMLRERSERRENTERYDENGYAKQAP